ncbi:MAG: hypothetical protein AB8B93_08955 [Pseudomonadales bacterium]
MEYFFEFHWWYVLVAFLALVLFTGKRKGGRVVQRFDAELVVLDQRFAGCEPEASYCVFKEGSPDHIEIELENLTLATGEELEFLLDGSLLATVKVEQDKEAEFDHWSDGDVQFPTVQGGEQLTVRYQGADVLQGTFADRTKAQ